MIDVPQQPNYAGPTTTANSAIEGRLKVGVAQGKKRKIIKNILNKKHGKR